MGRERKKEWRGGGEGKKGRKKAGSNGKGNLISIKDKTWVSIMLKLILKECENKCKKKFKS